MTDPRPAQQTQDELPGPADDLRAAPMMLGVATASFQIEGATDEDGRGPSIWDTFAAVPGTIADGRDGSVACDSYHRLDDDLDLLGRLGVDWYRFSIAWPRVIPEGTGRVEPRGLAYYDRLVDGLLEKGIAPAATLYHWDLPQPLEDRGGWLERSTAEAFAAYAEVVHAHLGDRVSLWATHNEPWCAAYLGYAAGVHAPGRREGGRAHRAAHHLVLGHGLAAERLHAAGAEVGIVLNLAPVWGERPQATAQVDAIDAIRNRVWLDPLVDGAYDEGLLRVAPELADPELVRDGDLDLVRGSADWIGVNYYTPVRPDLPGRAPADHLEQLPGGRTAGPRRDQDAYPGAPDLDLVVREPVTDIGWEIADEGLEELLVETWKRTGLPLVVSENGAAMPDVAGPDGVVQDDDRIAYLRDHLAATDRAREQGADVRAYLLWTLMDNFEWAEGYTKTFGLVSVDPTGQHRTPKASFHWYADQIAARRR